MAKFAVKKPMTIFVIVVLVCMLGYISFTHMRTDLLPSMDLPYIAVFTSYPGASPEKVEQNVTKPLEQSLSTVGGIKEITSTSNENMSTVLLEFNQSTNMDSAMIEINNKLSMAESSMDDAVGTPTLIKINPDLMPIMVAAVDVSGSDIIETSKLVNDELLPRFERIDGVGAVSAIGTVERTVEVVLDEDKINALNDRIKESIDDELNEAEEKIDDAKSEIESGKTQLEETARSQSAQIVEAGLQVSAGLEQINAALAAMPAMQESLTAQLGELNARRTEMETQLGETVKARDELAAAIAQLIEAGQPVPEEMSAQLAVLEQTIAQLEAGIEQVDGGIAQIQEALNAIPAQQAELEAKKAELQTAEKELESGKLALSTGLAEAAGQLASGEAQIAQQEELFEQQKDQAYKQANLDAMITQSTISQILSAQNFSMPAGYIAQGDQRYLVKVGDQFTDIEQIRDLALFNIEAADIGEVKLSDVATVEMTDNSDDLYAKINYNDGVLLAFQKQSTASTTDVSNRINDAIEEIQKENPDIHITALMDQGIYIRIVIDSVLNNLILGALFAVIVLFLFLRDIKPTIIVAISIPFSLLAALTLMYFCGVTLNIISLAGLALGVGMLVDNSIVVIENVYRLRMLGLSAAKASVKGAGQVAGAIAASTLTTICVFFPIVFTEGLTRQLFTDMGLTIAFSLLASLLIALSLVPAMSSLMLRKVREQKRGIFERFTEGYAKVLGGALQHKWIVYILVAGLFVFCIWRVPTMGTSLLPPMDSTEIQITMSMPSDATQQETRDMSDEVLARLSGIADVETIGAMESSSLSSLGMGGTGSNSIMMYALLRDNKQKSSKEIAQEMRDAVKDLPCTVSISDATMDMSAITGSGLEVIITGSDLDAMKECALQITQMMQDTEGLTSIRNGLEDAATEMRVTVDKAKAAEYNLTVAQVFSQLSAELNQGTSATTVTFHAEDYPVIVKNTEESNITLSELRTYKLTGTKDGEDTQVSLNAIADITEEQSLLSISRENSVRTMTVSAAVDSNHNIGLIAREFSEKLDAYTPPEGCTVTIAGENQTINDTFTNLIYMFAIAVALIYLIMVAQFQSLKSPFIVLFTIPLAFTGGLLALLFTQMNLSMIALLGFLVLAGVVVNNGIVFIDYTNQLRLSGIEKREALIRSGKARIRPILMTAFTTILGLVPFAAGWGQGADMLQPMAVVTIGGLVYATFMTLFFVPCLYDTLNKRELKPVVIEEDDEDDSVYAI